MAATVGADSQGDHSSGWEVSASLVWSSPVSFVKRFEAIESGQQQPVQEDNEQAVAQYIFGQPQADPEGSEDGDPSIPDEEEARRADPTSHLGKGSAPFYLAYATDDAMVSPDSAEFFIEDLERFGIPYEFEEYPGDLHGLELLEETGPMTVEFLDRYVLGSPRPGTARPPPEEGPGEGRRDQRFPVVLMVIVLAGMALIVAIAVGWRRRIRPTG
jgi:hypothetical protein